jgi:hypothetical protein
MRRLAVTGDARNPESSQERTASITWVRLICTTSGSYTKEIAGMLATAVMGRFCPLTGCSNTLLSGEDAQATSASVLETINNFFMCFPYSKIST